MLSREQLRSIRIIKEYVNKLPLEWDELIVLPEAGSNNYFYAPIIAAMGSPERAFTWITDSIHGARSDIKRNCIALAKCIGVKDKIHVAINTNSIKQAALANLIDTLNEIHK